MSAEKPEPRIVLDIWGGENSMSHLARFLCPIDEALVLARLELESGFLVNMRSEVAWGLSVTFDVRPGRAKN